MGLILFVDQSKFNIIQPGILTFEHILMGLGTLEEQVISKNWSLLVN